MNLSTDTDSKEYRKKISVRSKPSDNPTVTPTKYMPDSLSRVYELDYLSDHEQVLVGQIQARSYVHRVAVIDRGIKNRIHTIGHQTLESQRCVELLGNVTETAAENRRALAGLGRNVQCGMPTGYRAIGSGQEFSARLMNKSPWAILAWAFQFELVAQAHYELSAGGNAAVSSVFSDISLQRWRAQSHHAIRDGIAWGRADAALHAAAREQAVDDYIDVLDIVDDLLIRQSAADTAFFANITPRELLNREKNDLFGLFLKAYRWQFIEIGFSSKRFLNTLESYLSSDQFTRVSRAYTNTVTRLVLH